MNERIEKLFKQAFDQAGIETIYIVFGTPVPETWTALTPAQLSKLKDKFAELIVQECIDCVRGASLADDVALRNNLGFSDGIAESVVNIQKHFGVEE